MFFFPLFDDNPSRRQPYISWLIIALCVCIFLWQLSLGPAGTRLAFLQFGFIPANASGIKALPPELVVVPAWATAVTSMFLHGGFMHVGGNMLYLWIFGDNVEDSMGPFKFIIFYLLCGLAAAGAQFAIDPGSTIPMVGASGGIAGILGAYLVLHPKAAIRTMLVILIFIRFINLPAWLVLGVWIAGQFVAVPNALNGDGGGVAYFAHIGGFLAGMLLIPFFKNADVPLFGADDAPKPHWDGNPIPFNAIRDEAYRKYRRRRHNPLGSRIISDPQTPSQHRRRTSDTSPTRSDDGPWSGAGGQHSTRHTAESSSSARKAGSVPRFRKNKDR